MDYELNKKLIENSYLETNKFSKDQFKAVTHPYTNEKNLLLSAGAGCGKTYVLSNRILYLLETTDLSIDNFLVLTFTENSALDMKDKIKKVIANEINSNSIYMNEELKEKLRNELLKIDSSSISTFDSYANQLVSKNISLLHIKPDFSIIGDNIINYKLNKIIDKKIYEEFNNPNHRIIDLYFDRTLDKDNNSLKSMLKIIEMQRNIIPNSNEYFSTIIKEGFVTKEQYKKAITNYIRFKFKILDEQFNALETIDTSYIKPELESSFNQIIEEYFYKRKNIENELEKGFNNLNEANSFIKEFWGAPQSFTKESENNKNNFTNRFSTPSIFQSSSKIMNVEEFEKQKNIYKSAKDLIKSNVNDLFSLPSEKTQQEILKKNSELLNYLFSLSESINKELNQFKYEVNGYTFSDIVNFSLKILHDYPEIRIKIRNKYKVLMVDEYQDSNYLQEELLKILGTSEESHLKGNYYDIGNIFMVGDIKQSIYRFRNAVPKLFIDKINNQKEYNTKVITMNGNFRSSPNVIKEVNDIFSLVMKSDFGGIDYNDKVNPQNLIASNKNYENDNLNTIPCYTFDFYQHKDEELFKQKNLKSFEATERLVTADLIAKTIKETIDKKIALPNKEHKVISYSSFAILFRSTTSINEYIKALNKENIPFILNIDVTLNEQDVYIALKNLIQTEFYILNDDCSNDEYKFSSTSVKRSFIFNMYDDEIYQELNNKKEDELNTTLKNINKKYNFNSNSSILEIFNTLVDELDIYSKISTLELPDTEYSAFISFSSEIESLYKYGFNLEDAKDYFDYLKDENLNQKNKLYKPTNNAVTLTTIHKSKGLEYDIVFVPEVGAKWTKSKNNYGGNSIVFSKEYGVFLSKYLEFDRDILLSDDENIERIKSKKIDTINKNLADVDVNEFIRKYLDTDTEKFENIFSKAYSKQEEIESLSEEVRLFYVALTRAKFKIIFYAFNPSNLFDPSSFNPSNYTHYLDFIRLPIEYKDSFKELQVNAIPNDITDLIYQNDIQYNFNNIPDDINIELIEPISQSIFKEINIGKRASKDSIEFKDNSKATNKGLEMHSLLESINYKYYPNINLDYIHDKNSRILINNFLNFLSNVIKRNGIINPVIYQEYNFYDIKENRLGSMDLYIDSKDKGIIIDYKLKHIDDDAYINQLNTYRRNASSIFNHDEKDIKCYLYSIYDSDCKEI